jgi:hypothetical protein
MLIILVLFCGTYTYLTMINLNYVPQFCFPNNVFSLIKMKPSRCFH